MLGWSLHSPLLVHIAPSKENVSWCCLEHQHIDTSFMWSRLRGFVTASHVHVDQFKPNTCVDLTKWERTCYACTHVQLNTNQSRLNQWGFLGLYLLISSYNILPIGIRCRNDPYERCTNDPYEGIPTRLQPKSYLQWFMDVTGLGIINMVSSLWSTRISFHIKCIQSRVLATWWSHTKKLIYFGWSSSRGAISTKYFKRAKSKLQSLSLIAIC